MGIKTLLIIFISLGFSVKIFADNHENTETKTPAEEASIMPAMEDDKPPVAITEREVMFSGDFAGSYSILSNKVGPDKTFDVNLAQFNVKANMGQSHLNFGLAYGSTIHDINSSALLNASYHMKTSYGLGFMLGRFESPVGHETYNHRMNNQFTRSYGFDLAPYFSTGFGLNYGQKMWDVGLLVTNGGGSGSNIDSESTMAVTVDVDPLRGLHIDLNYVMGKEGDGSSKSDDSTEGDDTTFISLRNYSVSIIDASVSYMINDMFNMAVNYISNTIKPDKADVIGSTSLAAYINAKYSYFNFGLRYEQFSYDLFERGGTMERFFYNGSDGVNLARSGEGDDNGLSSITFSVKTDIDKNAGFLLEYRMDKADDKGTFINADNENTDSFNRFTAALMYNF